MKEEPTRYVRSDGTIEYRLNGLLHREDGPAKEWRNGYKRWYRNGQLHREDGPAAEWEDGTKAWYRNGQRHREDGPAVERPNGRIEYWLNGQELTEEEFLNQAGSVKTPRNNNALCDLIDRMSQGDVAEMLGMFADQAMRARWAEAEPFIMADACVAYNYAKELGL